LNIEKNFTVIVNSGSAGIQRIYKSGVWLKIAQAGGVLEAHLIEF
jgi:hypothetical protein